MVFTDRLSYWQFIQDVEYDIRVTKDKEVFNKNELIAVFRPPRLQEDFLNHIEIIGNIHDKARQKQALIDMMRGDEELGLYDEFCW